MGNEGKAWRCLVCGYIHYGDEPPEECPVCGAAASDFETAEQEAPAEKGGSKANTVVVAGAGIAGLSAAEAAREAAADSEIILLSAENGTPYYRLNLTRYLAGEITDGDLPIHPAGWYAQHRIDLRTGTRMEKINPAERTVRLSDGSELAYDKLIVATGAHPFEPSIPGFELPHVLTLRTADDAKRILASVNPGTRVAGIGGGILGLETAGALARRGAKVTVLEAFDHLMPRQLNEAGGELLQRHLGTLGIEVVAQAQAERIDPAGVLLKNGRIVPADMVVVTVGVRSNTEPFVAAGIPMRRGVSVDNFMRTSDPDILAAGDVCEHGGMMYGSWAAAQYQGRIAGMNAVGVPTEFGGIPRLHMLKVLGKDMFSIGKIRPDDGSDKGIDDLSGENYRLFMLRDGLLVGALLVGDLALMADCRKAIEGGCRVGSVSQPEQVVEAITAN